MTVNLIILPIVQIALCILMDLRYHSIYKWIVLSVVIALGLVCANISWACTIAGQDKVCGTGKPIVLAFALMMPLFTHMVYVVLKILKDTFS